MSLNRVNELLYKLKYIVTAVCCAVLTTNNSSNFVVILNVILSLYVALIEVLCHFCLFCKSVV